MLSSSWLQEASSEYVNSLLDLVPKTLGRVAVDPSGSRVLEAFLESPAPSKLKKKLLKKMRGHYAAAALTPAGNYLVEKCFTLAVRSFPTNDFPYTKRSQKFS